MTTAYWCLLIAGLLPYVATGIAKSGGGYDNRDPRGWLATQTGRRARANAAQKNSFEAFPFFAAAVFVAVLAHAPQAKLDLYAELFVAARVLYIGAYIFDFPVIRTLVWSVGMGAVIAIFCIA
jgi:uncharacterized MAPEG superfamily protein